MFFTFSTFAKINVVGSIAAAALISKGSSLFSPNFLFFSSVFQPNQILLTLGYS